MKKLIPVSSSFPDISSSSQSNTFLKLNGITKGVIIFIIIVILIGLLSSINESIFAYLSLTIITTCIYWIGYVGIHKLIPEKNKETQSHIKTSKKNGFATYNKVNDYILKEQKYLASNINLNSIAKHFDISQGYLSQLINIHANKSFNDHINELRIEASKNMLMDQEFDNYTIEAIGLECGFNSKSNFYTTFKKFSGLTPNQYKKLKK